MKNIVLSNEDIQNSSDLIELYNGLILFVESSLNPMKFLHFVQLLLSNYKGKMEEGKELIKFFCVPNRYGKRNMPDNASFKWELFKKYNERDVEVEKEIHNKLKNLLEIDFSLVHSGLMTLYIKYN